jgi:hypothetical protein
MDVPTKKVHRDETVLPGRDYTIAVVVGKKEQGIRGSIIAGRKSHWLGKGSKVEIVIANDKGFYKPACCEEEIGFVIREDLIRKLHSDSGQEKLVAALAVLGLLMERMKWLEDNEPQRYGLVDITSGDSQYGGALRHDFMHTFEFDKPRVKRVIDDFTAGPSHGALLAMPPRRECGATPLDR